MKEAVIVSAVRTAVGKAPKGTLRDTRPDEMGAAVIKEALARVPGLEASEIEDVIMGCAMPEAEQGMNVARAAAIRAGLPVETSAMTVNRFCSSGLQTIAMAADRIRTNGAEVILAGGLESMSMIPMGGHIIRPNPYLIEHYPDFYLNMGLATENVARKYEVSRAEQDEFALRSHSRAAAALDADKFKDETVPLTVSVEDLDAKGRQQHREIVFDRDEGPRRDTSADALAKLKPAFHVKGTITAGNSSQMSDGAAFHFPTFTNHAAMPTPTERHEGSPIHLSCAALGLWLLGVGACVATIFRVRPSLARRSRMPSAAACMVWLISTPIACTVG